MKYKTVTYVQNLKCS